MTATTPKTWTRADEDRVFEMGREKGVQEGLARGRTEGRTEERRRIESILTAAEAGGREPMARALAFGSDVSVESALGALRATPKAEPQPKGMTPLERAMAALGTPGIRSEELGSEAPAATTLEDIAARTYSRKPAR